MIYEIRIGETTHFMAFDDKRQATAWAIQQAGIEVRHATPEAMFAHLQQTRPAPMMDESGPEASPATGDDTTPVGGDGDPLASVPARRRNGKAAPVGA